jgi:hypothetical protein
MRFCYHGKDGGKESTVWGFWLIELKGLFSIVLLRFENGTRDAYHNHAFAAISWVLRGKLVERHLEGEWQETHEPSLRPIITPRREFHRVQSIGRSWVLSFRGPWAKTWREFTHDAGFRTLANGRRRVS